MLLMPVMVGCTPEDPLSVAWNRVFEIDRFAAGEGCEATEASEPPEPFVATALGMRFDGIFVGTTFFCPSPEACLGQPFSNAVLDVVGEDRIQGFAGEYNYDSRRVCRFGWAGLDATRTGDQLSLTTQVYTDEGFQENSDACELHLLSLYGAVCDQTVTIEATLVPEG